MLCNFPLYLRISLPLNYILQVYRADVILGKYCSDDNPPLLTSSRELTIYFHSDDSINRLGFKANYTIIDKEGEYFILRHFPSEL